MRNEPEGVGRSLYAEGAGYEGQTEDSSAQDYCTKATEDCSTGDSGEDCCGGAMVRGSGFLGGRTTERCGGSGFFVRNRRGDRGSGGGSFVGEERGGEPGFFLFVIGGDTIATYGTIGGGFVRGGR